MGTGSLISVSRAATEIPSNITLASGGEAAVYPEERFREQLLVHRGKLPLFYMRHGYCFANAEYFKNVKSESRLDRAMNWDKVLAEIVDKKTTIWDTPKLKKYLVEPLGSPVELTKEEAAEIVRLAYGRRPDLAPGEKLIKEIRELLGHSLIERLKKIE